MRTKIGKRIGPVPIALVAVLALAAFLSAGLLLVPGSGDVTQAQGLPSGQNSPDATGDKCGVIVFDGANATATLSEGTYGGGDCNVSGDSVDVVFENTNTDGNTEFTTYRGPSDTTLANRGVTNNIDKDDHGTVQLLAYVTGGSGFASVQAKDGEGNSIGRLGVDEHTATLARQKTSFGTTTPGSLTIPVTRSMADDDGKVYVFGYYNDADANEHELHAYNGLIDWTGDGQINSKDSRGEAQATDVNATAGFASVQIIAGGINTDTSTGTEEINGSDDFSPHVADGRYITAPASAKDRYILVTVPIVTATGTDKGKVNVNRSRDANNAHTITADDDIALGEITGAVDTAAELLWVYINDGELSVDGNSTAGEATDDATIGDITIENGLITSSQKTLDLLLPVAVNGMVDVNRSGAADTSDNMNMAASGVSGKVDTASELKLAQIIEGKLNVEMTPDGSDAQVIAEADDTDIRAVDIYNDGKNEDIAIRDGFLTYSGEVNYTFHDEGKWDKDSPRNVPFATGTTNFFPGTTPDGKNTVPADVAVVVQFLAAPALGEDGDDDNATVDKGEALSMLEATSTAALKDTAVYDGGSGAHTLAAATTSATITATVKDQYGNVIKGQTVTFTSTSDPADVWSGVRTATTAADGKASSTISGLRAKGPYKVTVVATVGDLTLGTIVIAKAGPLDRVAAVPCSAPASTGVKDAKDACGKAYDAKMVFNPEEKIYVLAKSVDSLDNAVSPTHRLTVAAADKANFGTPGSFNDAGVASVSVKKTAASGEYTLTVTAEEGAGDSMITKTAKVTVVVTGTLDHYAITGPARLQPRDVMEYTVQAQDSRDNPARFDAKTQLTDGKHTVSISVFADAAAKGTYKVLGDVADNPDVDLQAAASSATKFRIQAFPDAAGTIEISVVGPTKGGAATETMTVYLGADMAPTGMAIADQTVQAENTVDVTASFTDDMDTDTLTYAWSSDDTDVATVMAGETDMSMATITGVAAGTANVTVTATDSVGGEGMVTFMVTVTAIPMPPMASGTLDAVSLTVGGDAAEVDASGAFSMTEGDAITGYAATSNDDDVATASADAEGMVTINAVGAGSATVSVTAMDDDGTSDPVTIMVTVAADPTLGMPSGVDASGFNRDGVLQVSWTSAANAQSYIVIAVNAANSDDTQTALVNNASQTTAAVGGLTSGQTYYVFVAALGSGGANTLSEELVSVVAN